jgi:ADP-heptose:LPS heptosyltransferase
LWSSEGAPLAGRLVDATGRFSVAELMALLARVDAVVAASTGPLHLAAALGTPVVGLYGGGAPVWPARWHPVGPQARWLVADTARPDGTLDIPVGAVVEALEALSDPSALESRATDGSTKASAPATPRDGR